MPGMSHQKNIGAYVSAGRGIANTSATAGGSGDGVEVSGDSNNKGQAKSAVILIPYTATLAEAKTLSLLTKIQESSDGSTWDSAETLQAATVVATGGSGGTTETGCHKVNVNLSGRKEYIKMLITPDLSATGTDTAAIAGAWVFAGDDVLTAAPADATV